MATIDALPLSNRTRARLHEAGIRSLSQLSGLADDDLLRLRGFGHTCLREVRAVLRIFEERDAGMTIPNDTFPKSVPDSLLDTPLASLPISNRARGVFEREQIRTIGQFIALGEERLLRLRNFGETTLEAVNRAIHTAARRVESGDGTDLGSFAVSSLLARDNELKQSIAQIPVAALDLSRRARRACREMGLRTLKDLAGVSANEFLVRRNFGQATLLSIQDEVERFVRDYGSNPLTTFASVIDHLLSRLQQKERRLVELREGRGAQGPRTLTDTGRVMQITESRACQIEHAAWAKLRRFGAGLVDSAADRAIPVLMGRGGVASPELLSEDAYFVADPNDVQFLGNMLEKLLPHRLARLADGRLAAVPAATLATLAARLRKRLNRSGESQSLEQLAQEVLRGSDLGPEGPALVRALCEVLFSREVAAGPEGLPLVRTPSQGLGDDLRRILLNAPGPLHFRRIAQQLNAPPYLRTESTPEKVRLRLCRDKRFVLVRRGLYDLRERFSIDPALRRELADRAHALLQEAGRPTSVALVGSELRNEARFRDLNEFVIAAVLREDDRFRHLGRGTFVPAGSSDHSVRHVSEILEDVLRQNNGPLTYAELRQRVQDRRQVSDGAISATLVGRNTFLRIARGVFDLAERYPYDDRVRSDFARRTARMLKECGGVMSLSQLARMIAVEVSDRLPPPGDILLGDLLRRFGGFGFLGGGFIRLKDNAAQEALKVRAEQLLRSCGEPLRPSTIARRLDLDEAVGALLKELLRTSDRFDILPDGRATVHS